MRRPRRLFLHTFQLVFPALLLFCSYVPAMSADVSLSWDASDSPDIVGYDVYVGTSSQTYGSPIIIGNQITYTVTGLTPGTYYFALTAFDSNGSQSGYSNEVSETITADTDSLSIAITSPTSSATYNTSTSSLSLGGTVSDSVAVTQVT